jgi:hypothetical protein
MGRVVVGEGMNIHLYQQNSFLKTEGFSEKQVALAQSPYSKTGAMPNPKSIKLKLKTP